MKKYNAAVVVVSSLLMGMNAWGGEGAQSISTNPVSEPLTMRNTTLSLAPQVGVIGFTGSNGAYTTRGMAGIGIDGNVGKAIIDESGALRNFALSVSTGAFYSHLGSDSSNLFGSNPDQITEDTGANLLIIPADVKVGYYLTDAAKVSVHGGGNVFYASAAQGANFGQGSDSKQWSVYPNAGADLEIAVAQNVSLVARPDVTFFTTGQTLFTGSLGVNVSAF